MRYYQYLIATSLLLFNTIILAQPAHDLSVVLEKVMPAVVSIKAEGKLPPTVYLSADAKKDHDKTFRPPSEAAEEKPFISLGSGVIIADKKGYIITNAHVIKNADNIVVTLKDGRQFQATLLGSDEPSDIAVIQIAAAQLTQLTAMDSNTLEVGDAVVAIGNPFGLGETATSGIISALERSNLNIEGYESFIQIDAPINMGSSGGALITREGQLAGINTAMMTPNKGNVGIGFAIPANMVMNVAKQLVEYGKVERGILGVMVQTITPSIAAALSLGDTKGAIITHVAANSPAARAGLREGDIITEANDAVIKTSTQLVNTIGFIRVGDDVTLKLLREGSPIVLSATIIDTKKQEDINKSKQPFLYGIGFQQLNAHLPRQGSITGALVTEVLKTSNAWSIGLRPGDIIAQVNDQPISELNVLESQANESDDHLTLRIIRNDSNLLLVIPKELP